MYVPPTGGASGGNGTRRLLAADDFTEPVAGEDATVVFSVSLAPGVATDLGVLGLAGLYGVRAVTAGESAAHAISSQLVELLEPQPAGVAAGYAAGRFQFSGYLVAPSTDQIDLDPATLFPFTVNGTAGVQHMAASSTSRPGALSLMRLYNYLIDCCLDHVHSTESVQLRVLVTYLLWACRAWFVLHSADAMSTQPAVCNDRAVPPVA